MDQPSKPQINPFLKIALDLGPLVLFFIANGRLGIFGATAVFMIATVLALLRIPPIQLLFWASIGGGIGTPVTLALLVMLSRSNRTMSGDIAPAWLATAGWIVCAIIVTASVAFIRWH